MWDQGRSTKTCAHLPKPGYFNQVISGQYVCLCLSRVALHHARRVGREDEIVSGTALLPRFWGGLSVVSGLGPGLTR